MKNLLKEGEVLNDLLGYEGLKIIQQPGRFNFSLDSTLLADFVTLKKDTKKILDLCTGNAPIPLMMSLRTQGTIDAVDVQPESVDQACRSVAVNELEHQIKIHLNDLKEMDSSIIQNSYDVVTCNPPYFKVDSNSNLNSREALSIARHEVLVTLDDVVRVSAKMLNNNGRFAMVHRPDRLVEIIESFKRYQIEPKRLRFVYPRLGKEANGLLIEGVFKGKVGGLRLEPPIIVYEEKTNNYSAEILKIFNIQKREIK